VAWWRGGVVAWWRGTCVRMLDGGVLMDKKMRQERCCVLWVCSAWVARCVFNGHLCPREFKCVLMV
jgi:hypothetical protein